MEKWIEEEFAGTGKFESSKSRVMQTEGPVLVISYKRKRPNKVGITHEVSFKHVKKHTVCGLLMHSSLIISSEGLPLGLGAIKF